MAQKRIDFFGQFKPTGVDQTSAQVYREMANVASDVGNIAFEQGAEMQSERGRQAGLEAGAEGDVEERGNFTFYDKAYNEAALLSYRSEVRRDTKETLNRLSNQYEDDPEAFKQAAEKYREGIMEGMPEQFAPVINDDIANAIVDVGTNVENTFFQRQKEQDLANITESVIDLEDSIANAARNGNEKQLQRYKAERQALIKRGVDEGLINPAQAKKESERIENQIVSNQAIGEVQRVFAGTGTIEEKVKTVNTVIANLKENTELTPAQKDGLIGSIQTSMEEQVKLAKQRTAEEEKNISFRTVELQLDAQYGRRPAADIQSDALTMFQGNEISESEYRSILSNVIQTQQKQARQAENSTRVSKRLKGQ